MLQNSFHNLANAIFPPHCLACKKPGCWICKRCQNLLLVSNTPECAVCRRISAKFTTHPHCYKDLQINKVIICWQYNKFARKIMSSFKRNLRYTIVEQLIEICSPEILKYFPANPIFVPVPSTQDRIKNRGFNQSKIIADHLAQKTNGKVEKVLCRAGDTFHQTGQSREARLRQDSSLFYANPKTIDHINSQNVMIVDDVCTTGTTLKNCASTLRKFTPKSISAIVLFRGKRLSTKRTCTART